MEAQEKSTSCQTYKTQEEQFITGFDLNYLAVEANETTIGQSSSNNAGIGREKLNENFKPDENFFDLLYSTESPKQSSGMSSSSNSNELDSNAEVDHILVNECASDDSKTELPKHPEPKPELELEPESDNQVVEEHSPTQPSIEDNGRTP